MQNKTEILHKMLSKRIDVYKNPEIQYFRIFKRRRPDLNRCILVLQTIALPLGYCAITTINIANR